MEPYEIREGDRRDVKALAALWNEMMEFHGSYDVRFRFAANAPREFERHIMDTMRSRQARVLVAVAEGEVVGYILGEIHARKPIYPIGVYGFISDISVTHAWRRHGIGRALVESLTAWFRREGVTAVELFAADANPVSMAFWRNLGYADYLRLLRCELT